MRLPAFWSPEWIRMYCSRLPAHFAYSVYKCFTVLKLTGVCSRCNYVSSQPLCKACLLLEGLNRGLPKYVTFKPLTFLKNSFMLHVSGFYYYRCLRGDCIYGIRSILCSPVLLHVNCFKGMKIQEIQMWNSATRDISDFLCLGSISSEIICNGRLNM